MTKAKRKWLALFTLVAPVGIMLFGAEPSFAQNNNAQKISITMWQPGGAYPFNILIKDFERTHPNVVVNLVTVPKSDNYLKYTTAMNSGTGPNLVMTFGASPVQTWAADNLLMPLDGVMKQDHMKNPVYWPVVNQMIHYNGKLYGLPIEVDMPLLLWNKSLFKKAGLTQPPKTIAQLTADARKLTIFKNGQLVQAGIVTSQRFGDGMWVHYFGGQWYNPSSGKFVANNSRNVAAYKWLVSMYKMLGGLAQANSFVGSVKGGNAFLDGKQAMEIGGEWVPFEATPSLALLKGLDALNTGGSAALNQTPILNYGFAPVPVGPGLLPGSQVAITPGNTFVIPRGASHPKTTAKLLAWLTGHYGATYYDVNELNLTPYPADARVGSSLWKQAPVLRPWLQALKKAGMNAKPVVSVPISGYWDQISWNYEQEILQGAVSPEKGLTELNNEANNYLSQFKATHPN